jgi:hypothetical protein
LQDRLVKELKLAGVDSVAAADAFIRYAYLPAHDEILCVQEERQVGADNCCPTAVRPHAEGANPGKPPAPALRQGAGQGPRLFRRLARRLSRGRAASAIRRNGAIRDAKKAA